MDLTKDERDAILARMADLERRRHPVDARGERLPGPDEAEDDALREAYYLALAEYGDRLPRVVMGASPFSGAPVKRVFDPFGFDGPWWHKDRTWTVDDPAPPAGFQVELGAVDLRGRTPSEATEPSIPGPDVPFVVPSLFKLPGMVAVVMRLELATGDLAYPITYWSTAEIDRLRLHQRWLEEFLWGTDGGWTVSNARYDFDLATWINTGKLFWIEPGDETFAVRGRDSGRACPFVGLPGDRQRQRLANGVRELIGLPDGALVDPYADG